MTRVGAPARLAAALGRTEGMSWFRAPGRVNLVGDHTDYNDGFVLPLAIDRDCVIAVRPAGPVRIRSLDLGDSVEVAADGTDDPASVDPAWGRYVAGVVAELAELGRPAVGIDAVVASDVPLGSGLSSSAALEVACAVALSGVAEWQADERTLATACRAAEERATGVPCGIMDQLVSLVGQAGAAMLIDCRSLEARPVPLPRDLGVLVVNSGMQRSLDATPYADRRRACAELAEKLGIAALRDASASAVADEPLGRHVVSENARVLAAERALLDEDTVRLGEILIESHASLRDDFRVSTPELDVLVEKLVAAGAMGARLTGGGFGGAVIAVCPRDAMRGISDVATARYHEETGLEPHAFVCVAADGAGPLTYRSGDGDVVPGKS